MSQPRFTLRFTDEACRHLAELEQDRGLEKRLRAVRKSLGLLELNPRHPSLNTHEYTSLTRVRGKKVFKAYAESRTPAAYRIFWEYGPGSRDVTILAITRHP